MSAETETEPGVERVPLSRMRRRIGDNMVRSLATSPHVTMSVDVDYQQVDLRRNELAASKPEGSGVPTYLAFVAQAVCVALGQFGDLNASIQGTDLMRYSAVNLGVAVDLEQKGLVVPVLHGAQQLSLGELSELIRVRSAAAAEGRLVPGDVSGGTFTISSPGRLGADRSTPIIHQPQVGILAIDSIRKQVVPDPESAAVVVRPVGALSLSFDHRAVDGVYAAAFLNSVRASLEAKIV